MYLLQIAGGGGIIFQIKSAKKVAFKITIILYCEEHVVVVFRHPSDDADKDQCSAGCC